MIKLGILDFDTSHAVEFTKRLNHKNIAEDQWVEGARIVIGCPGKSALSPQLIPGYAKQVEAMGVTLVDNPKAMIGKVDGMLIEGVQGSVHLERARPFLEAGIPCYIDKPFANSSADAIQLAELADRKKVPIFSSSSLRYAPEVVAFTADASHGKVLGALAYGPAPLHEGNPGLYHYGIHPVELLFTVMGPGCDRVTCLHEKGADIATGQWKDGRLATVRGIREGQSAYGFIAFREKGVQTVTVGTTYIYRELLKRIVAMFETKKSPLPIEITIEVIAFIEAALKSANNHGNGEKVQSRR